LNETSVSKMKQMFSMGGDKTSKILSIFFENPTERFHLRRIADLTKVSPATVSRKLKNILSSNLLKTTRTIPILEVTANLDSQLFLEAKKIYNQRRIRDSGLLNLLVEKYNHPEAIVLFGSYAKGEDIEKSDIDIAVITEKRLNLKLDNFERELKRNIHLIEVMQKDIKPALMNNLANGTVLYGYLKVK
jgi:predicted nucleotidyltransferase